MHEIKQHERCQPGKRYGTRYEKGRSSGPHGAPRGMPKNASILSDFLRALNGESQPTAWVAWQIRRRTLRMYLPRKCSFRHIRLVSNCLLEAESVTVAQKTATHILKDEIDPAPWR